MSRELSEEAKRRIKNAPEAERLLAKHLRSRQMSDYRFRHQEPIGNYIVDFVCLKKKVIVEVDSSESPEPRDPDRENWLTRKKGYTILHFRDHEILADIVGVMEKIVSTLEAPSRYDRDEW